MRLTHLAGGITTTIVDEAMQRAPVFCFASAERHKKFGPWLKDNFAEIKAKAEATDPFCTLKDIEQYAVGNMIYTPLQLFNRGRCRAEYGRKSYLCRQRMDQEY